MLDRMDLTLAEYLKDHGPSPAARTRLLLRCSDLLLQVHDEDVCHNDIKAANFLLTENASRMVRRWTMRWRSHASAGCWDGSLSAAH